MVDRPEIELLLSCARTSKDSESVSQITSLLQGDMDWAYLLRTARQHGMMPLLYWPLSTTCPEAVLQAILNQLRNQLHRNAHRDLVLTAELLKLLVLCEAQGIRAISYKGPTLAALAYGNLSLENLLLVRCAHGSKHLWERLGWICDVAELIRVRKRSQIGKRLRNRLLRWAANECSFLGFTWQAPSWEWFFRQKCCIRLRTNP